MSTARGTERDGDHECERVRLGMSNDAIAELVHRYADAVVHHNESQWASTWADNATWDLGSGRVIEGREAIVKLWNRAMDGFSAVVQNVMNGTAEIDDAAGTGRWYVIEHFQQVDGTGGMLLAHYDDTYVRTGEGWQFASRKLVAHYAGPPDLSAPFLNRWS